MNRHHEENSSFRRRRRPLGFVGTAVTTALAVYGTYHLAMWAWQTFHPPSPSDQEDHEEHHDENTTSPSRVTDRMLKRRHNCLLQCKKQTAATLAAFSAILLKKIDEGTETTTARRQLKEIRKLQSEDTKHQESILWMSIQVETVTRLITMVYATSLLFTALTIQVHRMGGRMYLTTAEKQQSSSSSSEHDVHNHGTFHCDDGHHALLRSYDAFFWGRDNSGGLDDLLDLVRSATQSALKHWNIHNPEFALHFSYDTLRQAISEIRTVVEQEGDLLPRFVTTNFNDTEPAESELPVPSTTETLLNEMYDILESPVANEAMRDGLECVFTILQDQYMEPIFIHNPHDDANHNDGTQRQQRETVQALPHVISQLKSMTHGLVPTDDDDDDCNDSSKCRNPYVQAMQQLPSMQEAARVSFEAW